jgi:hypothetical protein
MKRVLFLSILFLSAQCPARHVTLSGKIEDENHHPVPFANVFVGSNGRISDDQGGFCFSFHLVKNSFVLQASMIGYEPYKNTFTCESDSLFVHITLRNLIVSIDEVVVKGATQKVKGAGSWSNLSPIEMVTTGGSMGDLYRSLQTVPGVQVQGESGRLVVRGGDSREVQTYIDDMHVLNPYTTTAENSPARSRYSPFMFAGINFSTGGYSQEYGDGLSAVLPLFTKDISHLSKWGVNPSTAGLATGGTKSFDKGSVSLNLDYTDMKPYFSVFHNRPDTGSPYQAISAATQIRFTPDDRTVFKAYISNDGTQFRESAMKLKENNLYINATARHTTKNDYRLFAGIAFSNTVQQIEGAVHSADHFEDASREWHLKVKASKRLSALLDVTVGMEQFIRRFGNRYTDSSTDCKQLVKPGLTAAFAIAAFYPAKNLNVDLSVRLEGKSLLSRAGVHYNLCGVSLTAAAGRYIQQPETGYLYANPSLEPEQCMQYVAGAKYVDRGKIYRAEIYYKDYSRLSLYSGEMITSRGYGYSKGVDLYFGDEALWKNMEYKVAYTLNFSKRKYGEHAALIVPYYASRHNVSVSLKYHAPQLKSIIGITHSYGSGKPWKGGFAKAFNSLDAGITVLAGPKLILYGSVSNLLGRKNLFSNAKGALIKPAYDRFVYLGVFLSLGGKSAYDVSNF